MPVESGFVVTAVPVEKAWVEGVEMPVEATETAELEAEPDETAGRVRASVLGLGKGGGLTAVLNAVPVL